MKLSDKKLAMMVATLVAFDFFILIIWQATSPLTASYSIVQNNGKENWYIQCIADSQGQKYAIVMVVTKAALVLFGCLMAFGTRRVTTTFNESKQIAWAIYNTVFGCAIIVPIIFVIGAIGDTLILLEVFLALWISFFTWAILFIPKLHALAENNDGFSEEASIRESTDGFSFLSVVSLPESILAKYVLALEKQLKAGKERLNILRKTAGPGTATGTARPGNASKLGSFAGPATNIASVAKKNSYLSQAGKSQMTTSPHTKPDPNPTSGPGSGSVIGNTTTVSAIGNPGESAKTSVIAANTYNDSTTTSNNSSSDLTNCHSSLKYRTTGATMAVKAEGMVRKDSIFATLPPSATALPTPSSTSSSAAMSISTVEEKQIPLFSTFSPTSQFVSSSISTNQPATPQIHPSTWQLIQQHQHQLQQPQSHQVPASASFLNQTFMQNVKFVPAAPSNSRTPMQMMMSPTSSIPSSPTTLLRTTLANPTKNNQPFPGIMLVGARGSLSQNFQSTPSPMPVSVSATANTNTVLPR